MPKVKGQKQRRHLQGARAHIGTPVQTPNNAPPTPAPTPAAQTPQLQTPINAQLDASHPTPQSTPEFNDDILWEVWEEREEEEGVNFESDSSGWEKESDSDCGTIDLASHTITSKSSFNGLFH
jgi:hypothetical protein